MSSEFDFKFLKNKVQKDLISFLQNKYGNIEVFNLRLNYKGSITQCEDVTINLSDIILVFIQRVVVDFDCNQNLTTSFHLVAKILDTKAFSFDQEEKCFCKFYYNSEFKLQNLEFYLN